MAQGDAPGGSQEAGDRPRADQEDELAERGEQAPPPDAEDRHEPDDQERPGEAQEAAGHAPRRVATARARALCEAFGIVVNDDAIARVDRIRL